MEHAHGPLAVLLQRGEERCLVLVLDATQDGEVQLRQVFRTVENATERSERYFIQLVHRRVRSEVAVHLRTEPLAHATQEGTHVRPPGGIGLQRVDGPGEFLEHALVVAAGIRHPETHDHRLDVVVEEQRDQRILYGAHHHRVVDEGIALVAALLQFAFQRSFFGIVQVVHEEHLEVVGVRLVFIGLQQFIAACERIGQHGGVASEGATAERAHHVVHREYQAVMLFAAQHVLQAPHRLAPRERPIELDAQEILQQCGHLLRLGAPFVEVHGGQLQLVPCVGAQARGVVMLAEGGAGVWHAEGVSRRER